MKYGFGDDQLNVILDKLQWTVGSCDPGILTIFQQDQISIPCLAISPLCACKLWNSLDDQGSPMDAAWDLYIDMHMAVTLVPGHRGH